VLNGVSRGIDPNTGMDTLKFTNMNLQVVSGSGVTNGVANGTGNLIIGYNELRTTGNDRSGSHMLVIGKENNYTVNSFGGMVVGQRNTTSARFATVSGGVINTASGNWSSIMGGENNQTSGDASSISGGTMNAAYADWSSISGGDGKVADTDACTVGDNGFDC